MRRLLTPAWLVRHALLLAAVIGMIWLGDWQLGRAHGSGRSWQNYGYAGQWWLFAAFTVFAWAKLVRDAFDPPAEEDDSPAGGSLASGLGYTPPAPPVAHDEDDEELAAYNRYLAGLHSNRGDR